MRQSRELSLREITSYLEIYLTVRPQDKTATDIIFLDEGREECKRSRMFDDPDCAEIVRCCIFLFCGLGTIGKAGMMVK